MHGFGQLDGWSFQTKMAISHLNSNHFTVMETQNINTHNRTGFGIRLLGLATQKRRANHSQNHATGSKQ